MASPGHRARAPVRRGTRHRLQRRHHSGDLVVADLAGCARPGLVKQSIQTPRREPRVPACHLDPCDALPLGDYKMAPSKILAFLRRP